mgnify:CR=1 FL=1
MNEIELTRIVCETILVALIWIIQLVIYPRFSTTEKSEQAHWHLHYTLLITAIISPLILLQFGILTYEWLEANTLLTSARLSLSCIVIFSTIFLLAPQHLKVICFGPDDVTFRKITKRNWIRTITWTGSLTISLVGFLLAT